MTCFEERFLDGTWEAERIRRILKEISSPNEVRRSNGESMLWLPATIMAYTDMLPATSLDTALCFFELL